MIFQIKSFMNSYFQMNSWKMLLLAFALVSCAAAFDVAKVEPKVTIKQLPFRMMRRLGEGLINFATVIFRN